MNVKWNTTIKKRIDATVYFGLDGGRITTTVWVDENASDSDIQNAIMSDISDQIKIEWNED